MQLGTATSRVPVVPRSMDLTARSPHPPEKIRSAFENDDYWLARLTAFEAGSPVMDHFSVDPTGQISVSVTMRFAPDQLPDVMRRLHLPALEVVQLERWSPVDDGSLRGHIAVDALRTPISGQGSVHLTSAGSGTQLVGTATVDVKLPLLGGPISKFIAGLLANGIVDIVHVTDSWLDANR
jgi:hypothetical protein